MALALLAIVSLLLLATWLIPSFRRVWAFHLRAFKYLLILLADRVGLRWLGCRLTGREYERATGPWLLREFCEDMGPVFIKFGQIIASSAGLFPERYVAEFQKCLDRVRPFSFDRVCRILETELGEHAADVEDIDPIPLASASVAQVHTARLKDGTEVVLKVQRPGVEALVKADVSVMRFAARVVQFLRPQAKIANPVGIVDDFQKTLNEEIDFTIEAKNLDRFNEIMRELGYADIRAPVPHWAYTTRRVLVMERFYGIRVDDVEGFRERGIDAEAMLVRGLRAWFQCVIFYGFFHGDVHAGNLMLLDDGDIGFIDFGIVGRFDEKQRWQVTDYIIAFATGNFRKLADIIADMGGVGADGDLDAFAEGLKQAYQPLLEMSFGELNYADVIPRINEVAVEHGMTMPSEFVLITKQMLYFDRYAKLLAPNLNVFTDPRLITSLMVDIRAARQAVASP